MCLSKLIRRIASIYHLGVAPNQDASDHQNYCIFSRGSRTEPSCNTVTGGGATRNLNKRDSGDYSCKFVGLERTNHQQESNLNVTHSTCLNDIPKECSASLSGHFCFGIMDFGRESTLIGCRINSARIPVVMTNHVDPTQYRLAVLSLHTDHVPNTHQPSKSGCDFVKASRPKNN